MNNQVTYSLFSLQMKSLIFLKSGICSIFLFLNKMEKLTKRYETIFGNIFVTKFYITLKNLLTKRIHGYSFELFFRERSFQKCKKFLI